MILTYLLTYVCLFSESYLPGSDLASDKCDNILDLTASNIAAESPPGSPAALCGTAQPGSPVAGLLVPVASR